MTTERVLGVGCWVLGVGCWVLGRWRRAGGLSPADSLNTQHPTPNTLPNTRLHCCLLSAVCCLFLAGCKDAIDNLATDDAMLRTPTQTPKALKPGSLLPLTPGMRWKIELRQGDRVGEEEEVVTTSRPVGGFTETVIETRARGRAVRQEAFRWNDEVTQMASAGFADKVTLEPSLPLFRNPATPGETLSWSGVLRFKGANAPGRGASRISGTDKVQTPAGIFDAYRVDTVILTTVSGRDVAFRMTRWLAPGVGVVRQRTSVGATVVEKKLASYQVR